MSATRLLVLGLVRIVQPVHGYEVRRELLSWHLGESVNLRPGSIYGALRTLEKDGCIAVHSRESGDNRPERTRYAITPEGEKEFQILLRRSWWTVTSPVEPLLPALCLMGMMPRGELIAAVQARVGQLEGQLERIGFTRATIRDGATGADGQIPEHVREILDFGAARARAELEWARGFQARLRAGHYWFEDDGPPPRRTAPDAAPDTVPPAGGPADQ